MGSGLIYLAIVVVWAAILIPMFLRGRDAAMEDRSVERFDHAMSILSQQEEAELPQAPEYQESKPVAAHRSNSAPLTTPIAPPRAEQPARRSEPARAPRRRTSLARRRARTLLVLTALAVFALLLALTPLVPFWAPIPFAALLVAFVVHLRNQAIRTLRRRQVRVEGHSHDSSQTDGKEASVAARDLVAESAAAPSTGRARSAQHAEFVPGPSRAVVVETKGSESAASGDLDEAWRPNPLPLPTYVTAPKAVRPIRVIDLTTPGAWTSGRVLDDDAAMEDVLAEQVAADELDALLEHEARGSRTDDDASRRAVGD